MKNFLNIFFLLVFVIPLSHANAESRLWIVAVDGLSIMEIGPEIGIFQRELSTLPKRLGLYKEPGDYLGKALREAPDIKNMSAIVQSNTWSRDPGDSRTEIDRLKVYLSATYKQTQKKNSPLIIIAHSWGTVLSYAALHELGNEVKIDCFITMGSPLNPRVGVGLRELVLALLQLETIKEGLPKGLLLGNISKLQNVTGKWINLWAKGDTFSNEITSANENIQIDKDQGLRVIGEPELGLAKWHAEYYKNPAILSQISKFLIALRAGVQGLGKIGPEAVFRPNPDIFQENCKGGGDAISAMRKLGASPQAIAFAQANEDNFFLTKFVKFGPVDLGVSEADDYFVFANPHGEYYFLVNGNPQIIAIQDIRHLKHLNLNDNNPWSKSNPSGMMSFKYTKFDKQETRPEGGQRFIFGFPIYKGSHAGGIYGYVQVAYDCDSSGHFLGTKMLGPSGNVN